MEFVEGIREKDTLELRELLKKQETDGEILVEGTVHSIRTVSYTHLDFKLQSYSDGYRIQRIRKAKE